MCLRPLSRLWWVLPFCLALAACSGLQLRSYGAINADTAATKALETHQVNADYRYYVSGGHLYPNALMGLHKDYRLDPRTLWRAIEMTPAVMKETVENMQTKAAQVRKSQHGFALTDPAGKTIGLWYSILDARTFLKINDDGTIRIDTPPWDVYDKYERDSYD